eukprot:TRINITY_DN15896_c0_g1_i1.p1 TRINITY_DN15896_c0_g1~~TRINITY_DN15896_c0_g1_i1.p1  ORF type:complete len:666 (+),score=65.08 TRINITY_DN15896_c0_g1_i1:299-1999(+)
MVASIGLISIGPVILGSSKILRGMFSYFMLEIVFSFWVFCVLSLVVVGSPWYACRLYGYDPTLLVMTPEPFHDASMLLMLDAIVTAVHFASPIRWFLASTAGAYMGILYVFVVVALGSPMTQESVIFNTIQLVFLAITSCIGKRSMELHDRRAWVSITAERIRRATAEYKLEEANHIASSPTEEDQLSTTRSIPATTYSEELFSSLAMSGGQHDSTERTLRCILELGAREHWLIPSSHFRVHGNDVTVLGRGSFGLVIEAEYYGAAVAVKSSLVSNHVTNLKELGTFSNELRMSRRLRHPSIVSFLGACIIPQTGELWLVTECVRGTSFDKALLVLPPVNQAFGVRVGILQNISGALCFMHAQSPCVVHGDIKASNVVVEETIHGLRAKLLDFGLSRFMKNRSPPLGGTCAWMAPEVGSKSALMPDPSADVFSFGILFCLALTGIEPLHQRYRRVSWSGLKEEGQTSEALHEACSELDPVRRPCMREVCSVLQEMATRQNLLQQHGSASVEQAMSLEEAVSRARAKVEDLDTQKSSVAVPGSSFPSLSGTSDRAGQGSIPEGRLEL